MNLHVSQPTSSDAGSASDYLVTRRGFCTVLLMTAIFSASCVVIHHLQTGPTVREHWRGYGLTRRIAKTESQYADVVEKQLREFKERYPQAFAEVEADIASKRAQIEDLYATFPDAEKKLGAKLEFGIEDYYVRVGMPKEAVRVLYGKPTRVRGQSKIVGGTEIGTEYWEYNYADGSRWTFIVIDGKVQGVLLKYLQAL